MNTFGGIWANCYFITKNNQPINQKNKTDKIHILSKMKFCLNCLENCFYSFNTAHADAELIDYKMVLSQSCKYFHLGNDFKSVISKIAYKVL